jgi:predicted RNase H-like HicB family nuclease
MPEPSRCVSQGRTREEAIANIRDAIELSLETRAANGIAIPESIEVEVSAARAA